MRFRSSRSNAIYDVSVTGINHLLAVSQEKLQLKHCDKINDEYTIQTDSWNNENAFYPKTVKKTLLIT